MLPWQIRKTLEVRGVHQRASFCSSGNALFPSVPAGKVLNRLGNQRFKLGDHLPW
jgi:hypothetical protein